MAEKRKRETLELESKIAIINELENGQKQSFICKTRNLTKHFYKPYSQAFINLTHKRFLKQKTVTKFFK
jgi:hypothetical protein